MEYFNDKQNFINLKNIYSFFLLLQLFFWLIFYWFSHLSIQIKGNNIVERDSMEVNIIINNKIFKFNFSSLNFEITIKVVLPKQHKRLYSFQRVQYVDITYRSIACCPYIIFGLLHMVISFWGSSWNPLFAVMLVTCALLMVRSISWLRVCPCMRKILKIQAMVLSMIVLMVVPLYIYYTTMLTVPPHRPFLYLIFFIASSFCHGAKYIFSKYGGVTSISCLSRLFQTGIINLKHLVLRT